MDLRLALRLAAIATALACAPAAPRPNPAQDALPAEALDPSAGAENFLEPNAEDSDGAPAYVHFTPEDMPLRVNVQLPKLAARYASREQTDAAVVEGIKGWEAAIHPVLPWFVLEIVRDDKAAPIQVEWKTRITNGAAGRGGIDWRAEGGRLVTSGYFEYATKPCMQVSCQLDVDQLRMVVTHEFGHVLGLGHCLSCDSAMNYSWETRERVLITDVDLRTIRALYALPSGTRADGQPMLALRGRASQ